MATIKGTDQLTLLQEFYSIAMDKEEVMDTRLNAAKLVAPYMFRKMPVSSEVEIKGNEGIIAALKEIYGLPKTTEDKDNTQ